jgi:uncharacterized protein with NAD-binding domain and iron-sulfur cluster
MAKRRVAILGGGAAALAAAFAMSARSAGRYDITVYQIGWRLGGKGASSRDPARRSRNEEHGLHVLGGFYHNAFALLRACYAEWAMAAPTRAVPFDEMFTRQTHCTVMDRTSTGWRAVDLQLPEDDREPGVDPSDLDLQAVFLRIMEFLKDWVAPKQIPPPSPEKSIAAHMARIYSFLPAAKAQTLVALRASPGQTEAFKASLRDLLNLLLWLEPGWRPSGREINPFMMGAVALVCAIGMLEDDLFSRGFDDINDQELGAWLRLHGANDRLIDSATVRAGYDYAFAYADGQTDPAKPCIAAGVALRAFLRLVFTYHGALFFHMQGGMGEAVFTPLYDVLRARGVKFRFFHRIDRLALDAAGDQVETITFRRQAAPKAGETGYDPLIRHGDHWVWPPRPQYGQLADGAQLEAWDDDLECRWAPDRGAAPEVLRRGVDFDDVVLGISVGGLKDICDDLIHRHSKWRDMIDSARTIPVAGAQIWSGFDRQSLGWPHTAGLATAYAQPFATWCDLSILLPREDDGIVPLQTLHYVCAPYPPETPQNDAPGSPFPAQQAARVESLLSGWLDNNLRGLLPGACDPVTTRPLPAFGVERFIRANASPSDHYVLSPPGSIDKRLRADGCGLVKNLYLAGDWTRTGLDAGAFEAAVMSGLQCARAVTGEPIIVHGETDKP